MYNITDNCHLKREREELDHSKDYNTVYRVAAVFTGAAIFFKLNSTNPGALYSRLPREFSTAH